VAVVTGGGRGIGRGYAVGLAEHGYRIVIADRNGDAGDAVAKEIEQAGGQAIAVTTDVGDEASVDAMVAAAVEAYGGVHVLLNNAAIFGADIESFDPISWDCVTGSLDEWRRSVAVNVEGVLYGCRAVAPVMRAQGFGRIINQSSAGIYYELGTLYTLTKVAVNSITRMFAKALATDGVTVNSIAPGVILSDAHIQRHGSLEKAEAATQAYAGSVVPLGRAGRPDDLLSTILYLAAPESAYVTGQTIAVDGGWLSRF
jgi:NAD(P)-dependent dehydrogenase (short-subunit alcohol dehydrogenase family)